jgi:hypothetical protein
MTFSYVAPATGGNSTVIQIARRGGGGRINFRNVENGLTVVDEWTIDVPRTFHRASMVLSAIWPDGARIERRLPSLSGRVTDSRSKEPIYNAVILFPQTAYYAGTDSTGSFTIGDVYPGPYTWVAYHQMLARYASKPTATGDITTDARTNKALNIQMPPLLEAARSLCAGKMANGETVVLVLAVDTLGIPARGLGLSLTMTLASEAGDRRTTGLLQNSRLAVCNVPAGTLSVSATDPLGRSGTVERIVSGGPAVDTITVMLRPRR